MKQIESLMQLIKNPKALNVKVNKNSRVYKALTPLLLDGVVQTGDSGQWMYYNFTDELAGLLSAAGITMYRQYNDAPRGGAHGWHVALTGKLKKDAAAVADKIRAAIGEKRTCYYGTPYWSFNTKDVKEYITANF